ncbi:MAG: hypothetical protein BJ554DRAFT_4298, partial [Olpidium bornovanus]
FFFFSPSRRPRNRSAFFFLRRRARARSTADRHLLASRGGARPAAAAAAPPRFTVLEKISNEAGWLLQMDVPGFSSGEVRVYALGPAITVRGTHACPVKSGGHRDPICIERHVFEEVRFPDDADMETARAALDHGVLKVSVKPFPDYRPRGRPIHIMDALGGTVHESGEAVKEKVGLPSDGTGDDEDWNPDALETEEQVRRTVDRCVDSVRRALRVPREKEQQFERLVRARTDGLVGQFRRHVLTAQQVRDRIRRAAEDIWEEIRQEAGKLGEDVGRKASQAFGSVSGAGGVLKEKAQEARGEASARLSEGAGEVGRSAKTAAQRTKEAAEELAGGALRSAERGLDESARRAGRLAGEAAEKPRDAAAKGAAHHRAGHRAPERAEGVQGPAREGPGRARPGADEAAQKAAPRVARRQDAEPAEPHPKGVFASLKQKFWWGSA